MKKVIYLFALAMATVATGCHDDDGSKPSQDIPLFEPDAQALEHISRQLNTQAADYPSPWNPNDMATWGSNITLDTITSPFNHEPALAVSGITLYITDASYRLTEWLKDLSELKELKVYSCAGAVFEPNAIPSRCKSFSLAKINAEEPGCIHIFNESFFLNENWQFDNFVLNGTDAKEVNVKVALSGTFDVSHNQISQPLDNEFFQYNTPVNLSYNRISESVLTWEEMVEQTNIPNLQYNELEIPQWVTETEWWKTYHECFMGNPGYIAPAK